MLTLYIEELRALMRGRFAWVGTGVVLLGIGGLAAAATQDTWLDSYGLVAYFLAPLAFIPLAAGVIAAPRANRFVECVFTAPVERGDWLVAKVLVLLTLAVAYYAALLPLLTVYVAHVGMSPLLAKLLGWAPGILLASIAVGTVVGVLFIGRSVAPPIATSIGIMLIQALSVPLQELLVARGYGTGATSHLTLASPAVLLKNALGFALVASSVPASTLRSWCCFAFLVVGSFALARWIFLRAQGVESWEATRNQRRAIVLAMAALVLVPVFFADANYDAQAPVTNTAPSIRGLFARGGGVLALTDRGGQMPSRCCGPLLNRDEWPSLPVAQASSRDLLIMLPVTLDQTVSELTIQVDGSNGLKIATDPHSLATLTRHLEQQSYPDDTGPLIASGQHIRSGWVARVPIVLTPSAPWDLGGLRYPLNVTATFRIGGDAESHDLTEHAAIEAQVSSALTQMSLAGVVLPCLCFGLGLRRRRARR